MMMKMKNNGGSAIFTNISSRIHNVAARSSSRAAAHQHSMLLFSSKHTASSGGTIPREYVDFKRVKTVSDAISLFDDMLRMWPLHSVIEFNKMLSFVVKMDNYTFALHLFDKMRQCGVPYDEYTLNIVINCCCHLNSVDHGFAVLGISIKSGIRPDVTTFTTLLKGLFLENKVTQAEMLFRKMPTCERNEVTLSTVIDGLCKARYRPTALTLLENFEKQRCKPDVHAYSSIIDSFCKDLMIDEALQFFSKMVQKGISPNVVTYSSLIQGLCDSGRWKEAKEFSNQMLARGILPDIITYNISAAGILYNWLALSIKKPSSYRKTFVGGLKPSAAS